MKQFNSQQEAIEYINNLLKFLEEDPADYDVESFVDYYLLQSVDGVLVYQVAQSLRTLAYFEDVLPEYKF